jgi:hypothetical protein
LWNPGEGFEPKARKRISRGRRHKPSGTPAAPFCRAMIGGIPYLLAEGAPGHQAARRTPTRRKRPTAPASFREAAPALTAVSRAERLTGGADAFLARRGVCGEFDWPLTIQTCPASGQKPSPTRKETAVSGTSATNRPVFTSRLGCRSVGLSPRDQIRAGRRMRADPSVAISRRCMGKSSLMRHPNGPRWVGWQGGVLEAMALGP